MGKEFKAKGGEPEQPFRLSYVLLSFRYQQSM